MSLQYFILLYVVFYPLLLPRRFRTTKVLLFYFLPAEMKRLRIRSTTTRIKGLFSKGIRYSLKVFIITEDTGPCMHTIRITKLYVTPIVGTYESNS